MLVQGSSLGAAGVGVGILIGLLYASFSSQGEIDTRWSTLVRHSTELGDLSATESKRFILLSTERGQESCALVRRKSSDQWEVLMFEKSEVGKWQRGSGVLFDRNEMMTFARAQGRVLDSQFTEDVMEHVTSIGSRSIKHP